MGGHKEWRKVAKKLRRKRIRSHLAKKRDELLKIEEERLANSPTRQAWLEEQATIEKFELEEEERQSELLNRKWMEKEAAAQEEWKKKQERIAKAEEERRLQIILVKERLLEEEKVLKEEKERQDRLKEEARLEEERVKQQISDFITGLRSDLPIEARISRETHPGKQLCPFFNKVAACRFMDNCSRNHVKPGVSKVLLFPSFYSHFSFYHHYEYDTDVSLEFANKETYKHFLEFYRDIIKELRLCGKLRQVKVCKNSEPHLRGNVYVEYKSERSALKAYSVFQGRYYGGKQLSVYFVSIPSWRQAICGEQWRNKCSKGSSCNFLHVFNNPNGEFRSADFDRDSISPEYNRSRRSERGWSSSPERSSRNEKSRSERSNRLERRKRNDRRGSSGKVDAARWSSSDEETNSRVDKHSSKRKHKKTRSSKN